MLTNYAKLENFLFNSDLPDSILPVPGGRFDSQEDANGVVQLIGCIGACWITEEFLPGGTMDFSEMSREDLIKYISDMNDYMDNVIVFWGDKRELQTTFRKVAENSDNEFTEKEADNASTILNSPGAFDRVHRVFKGFI